MGVRSKVDMLPEELRSELERRVVARAFSGYQDLADWLQQQGYQIAEDSVQRYGHKLKRELEAMERAVQQAEAIAKAAPGGDEAVIAATLRVVNQRVFSALVDATQLELRDLPRFVRMAAELSRTATGRQRRAEQVRAQLEQQKPASNQAAEQGGLSEQAYQAIRNASLGIDPFAPGAEAASTDPAASTTTASPGEHTCVPETAEPGTPPKRLIGPALYDRGNQPSAAKAPDRT